jgi:menaquinone-dependent protoporphyrinogen oxidase
MDTNKQINRRQFLKTFGVTLGAAAVVGTAQWALNEPDIQFPQESFGKEQTMQKILVAYASKCGSTAEIAAAVGSTLAQTGFPVDVISAHLVKDLDSYPIVVLGTALRMEKPIPEMSDFVKKFRTVLQNKTLACFSAGVYMRSDTPENREKTMEFLTTMLSQLPPPISIGLFGGKVDLQKLSPFWRLLISQDKSLMREGDGRDWTVINAWAEELSVQLA